MPRRPFPSTPEAVASAVRFAEERAQACGLPDEALDRIALAVGEAAGNAVEHGNQEDAALVMYVSCEADGTGCWVRVEDQGTGLDPALMEDAELPDDPLSTSGRGLFLIRMLADDVQLEKSGRCIAMRFSPRAGD